MPWCNVPRSAERGSAFVSTGRETRHEVIMTDIVPRPECVPRHSVRIAGRCGTRCPCDAWSGGVERQLAGGRMGRIGATLAGPRTFTRARPIDAGGGHIAADRAKCEGIVDERTPVRGRRFTHARGATRLRERSRTRSVPNARCPGMQCSHPGASMEAIECVYRGWRDYEMRSPSRARARTVTSDPLRR